jgi:hypothetical protein
MPPAAGVGPVRPPVHGLCSIRRDSTGSAGGPP